MDLNNKLMGLFQDVVNNAPVERAGWVLIEAANEFPALRDAILDNLEGSPGQVLDAIKKVYPAAGSLIFLSGWQVWVSNLQVFFKEAQRNGKI